MTRNQCSKLNVHSVCAPVYLMILLPMGKGKYSYIKTLDFTYRYFCMKINC